MKTFAWHVLILGGFYFIISLLSFFPENSILNTINIAAFIIFALMFFLRKNIISSADFKTNLLK